MAPIWKNKPYVGLGLGVGLLGAVALAIRHRNQNTKQAPIPDEISPTIFATRVAQTLQGQIVYHICGSGEPIVFLHGFFLGASSYEWSKIYSRFAHGREVIAPDLIGFGESERPSTPMDAGAYADSIAELLREIAPNRPAVIVASGVTCNISLLLAARHPELVSRLVLFLPSSLKKSIQSRSLGLIDKSRIPNLSRFIYRNHYSRAPFIRSLLTKTGFINPDLVTDETVSVLATCANQYGAEHAIFGFMRNLKKFDVRGRVADVLAPVHILWPERAAGFDISEANALCKSLPKASLETLPNGSLFAPLEMPAEVSDSIFRWLDGDMMSASVA